MTNPLSGFLTAPDQSNPLTGFLGGGGTTDQLDTATGRAQYEAGNIADNIAKLTSLREKSNNSADQARIDRVIASLKRQQGAVGKAPSTGSTVSDLVQGAASGVAQGPVNIAEGFTSTGSELGDQLLKGPLAQFRPDQNLRRSLAERAAQITEATQPAGVAGSVGEFIGELPAQAVVFGPIASKTGEVVSKIAPSLAPFFEEKIAGGIAKRAAVGAGRAAIEIAPVNALMAASSRDEAIKQAQQSFDKGELSQEGLDAIKSSSTLDAIKSFAASTAGAAAFGAVFHPGKAGEAGTTTTVPGKEPAPAPGPSQVELLKREAELQAINAKAKADAAAKAEVKQTKKLAKAQWTLENPEGNWTDLETSEQADYIKGFKAKRDAAAKQAATPPVASGGEAVAGATPTEPEQELSRAQAAGTPEAIQAAQEDVASGQPATPAPAVQPVRSPNLDKGSGGLSPQVRNFVQRQGYKKAFAEAGLDFDEGLTNDQLKEKLNQHIAQQANAAKTSTEQAKTDSAKAQSLDELLSSSMDAGKRLGIDQDIRSMHAQGKTNNEILAVVDKKMPDYMTPSQKIDLIQALRDDLPPSRVAPITPETVDTSYFGLTGESRFTLNDIKAPAVRDPATGRVFEGAIHADAIAAARRAGIELPSKESWENGYSTNDGHFVSREEGEAIAQKEDATLEHGPVNVTSGEGREVVPARTMPVEGAKPSDGTVPSPTAPPAVAVAVAEPKQTILKGVQHDVPLEKMTTGQLDQMKDLVADGIAESKDPTHTKQLLGDLDALAKETQRRESQGTESAAVAVPRPYQHLDPSALLANREALEAKIEDLKNDPTKKAELADARTRLADIKSEIGAKKIEARETQRQARTAGSTRFVESEPEEPKPIPASDFRKPPSKLGDEAIDRQIDDIHTRLEVLDARDAEPWQKRLNDLYEEKAKRDSKPEGPGGMPPIKSGDGFKLQSHPAVGAFLGGFTYGLIPTDQNKDLTDEEYLSRALMWGLGSAGLVMGAKYLGARWKAVESPKSETSIPGLDKFPKKVFSIDELKGPKSSTLARLREFYRGTVRGTEAIERMVKSTGGLNLPTQKNPGKLAAYYGRYAAQTEHWLTTGPALVDNTGNVTRLEGLSHNDIINQTAKGDKEGLDNLMVALSSAELAGKLGENRVPMNQVQREWIIRNAPPNLMEAAKQMRQYHANLLMTQLDAGLISKEGMAKMVAENYYTPMQRVIERLDEIAQRKPNFKGQPTAIEERLGGSTLKVKSPSDVTVEMTGRMLRAAEYGKFLNAFVEHVQGLPSAVRQEILVPTNRSMNPKAGELESMAIELRKLAGISEADARSMVAYLDSDQIHSNPGIITHYENGVLKSYKVRPDIFMAIKSMTAPEIDGFWRLIGLPTRIATQGTVLNPAFTFRRTFIETFLGHLGSEYGFRPVLDQIPAWWEAFTRSPRFREMQAAGGTGTVQSLQFRQMAKFGKNNALIDSWNLVKEMHPVQAFRTLMEPFTMTARVAEYLAALRHGASTLEAAYAANNLLGNVRMQGYMNGMRVFNHLSMFARPTIAHIDRLVEKSGFHPYRVPEYNKTSFGQAFQQAGVPPRIAAALTFMTKGFTSITLPTIALWYMNKDDDEINQLRRTDAGSHYWFMRNPTVDAGKEGSIVRMPRPQVIGQVFGGSAEASLDKMDKEDPDGLRRMLSGIYDEAALNVLPQIGVVPMGLWANRDYRFGSPIVPGSDENADPSVQGFTNASLPSRIISDKLSSISNDSNNETLRRALSPAGVDYVLNTFAGMMGQDALRAVNDAMLYHRDGFLPAKEELPIISRFLARYPSMNTYEVQKFYERDKKVQAASATVDKMIQERPELLGDYYSQNSNRLMLARVHQEVRQKIADMRRAIEDLKNAPAGTYDQQTKDQIQKQFTELIIQHAKVANDIAKGMEENK